jgi:hypothetical protein
MFRYEQYVTKQKVITIQSKFLSEKYFVKILLCSYACVMLYINEIRRSQTFLKS